MCNAENGAPFFWCVSARMNHGPCQILWEMKCQRAACLLREKPTGWQYLQRQEIQRTFFGNQLPFVQSRQYLDPNPLAPQSNHKLHLYNPWEFMKCFHGCYLMEFVWVCGRLRREALKSFSLLKCLCLLSKLEPWKLWPPLGMWSLPLNNLPPSNLGSEKSWLNHESMGDFLFSPIL